MNQAKFTNFCKRSSIVLPLLDPEYVKNTPLRKSVLPVQTVPHSTRLESGTSEFTFRFFLAADN